MAREGLERASTNKIAQRAGVSIGSVYRYFPDKESLVDAIIEDRLRRLDLLITERLMGVWGCPYPEAVEAILRASVEFYASEPELMRVLLGRIRRLANHPSGRIVEERTHQTAKSYLRRFTDELEIEDLDVAASISTTVIGTFGPRIALQVPEGPERELMIGEVVKMLSRYLQP